MTAAAAASEPPVAPVVSAAVSEVGPTSPIVVSVGPVLRVLKNPPRQLPILGRQPVWYGPGMEIGDADVFHGPLSVGGYARKMRLSFWKIVIANSQTPFASFNVNSKNSNFIATYCPRPDVPIAFSEYR